MANTFSVPIIPDRMYFKIGEVCKIAGIKPYVLRYWETEFEALSPQKSKANQRVYEKKDIETISKKDFISFVHDAIEKKIN